MLSIGVLIIELFMLMLLQLLEITVRPVIFIAVLIGLFSIAYFEDLKGNKSMVPVRIPLMIGYLLRLSLLFFDIYGNSIFVLPNSGGDARMFYNEAVKVAFGGTSERGLFVYVIAFIFKHFGLSKLYTQFLLVLCSVVAIHMGDRILRECEVAGNARFKTMIILCCLPNFAILSSVFLRESIVTMFIAISLYFFVCWFRRRKLIWFIFAVITVLTAMSFHSGVIAVLIAFFISLLLYNKEKRTIELKLSNMLITTILLTLGVFFINRYGNLLLVKFVGINSINEVANVRDVAGSSYVQYVGNSNSLLNMVIFTIPRLIFFLFSPMPFQWRGISDVIAFFFSSLFYFITIWRTFKFILFYNNRNKILIIMLLMVAFASMFVFAWGVSNAGTAVRHRDKMIILYGALYGLTTVDRVYIKTTRKSFRRIM